ncbi:MAG: YabP/YqfC family sporulation protein [Bacilli bacterium]|nr:YabP/YqfC family sporulation protein [Bacilli bacterium]
MKYLDKFREYILEQEFKIIILNNKINIVNYDKIDHFDFNKIIVRYMKERIIINGDNLVISKLLNDELLITGNIKTIELR